MVIWPKSICENDNGWRQACALMQVLALDPRQPSSRGCKPREYYDSADDILVRPMIWVDKRHVAAPYFQYRLHFAVSASVHGSIAIDSVAELEEFRRRVNAAIQSPLTIAERRRWETNSERLKGERAGDYSRSESLSAIQCEESTKAMQYYDQMREVIETPRRFTNYQAAGLSKHEEILGELIRLGTDMLQVAHPEQP